MSNEIVGCCFLTAYIQTKVKRYHIVRPALFYSCKLHNIMEFKMKCTRLKSHFTVKSVLGLETVALVKTLCLGIHHEDL